MGTKGSKLSKIAPKYIIDSMPHKQRLNHLIYGYIRCILIDLYTDYLPLEIINIFIKYIGNKRFIKSTKVKRIGIGVMGISQVGITQICSRYVCGEFLDDFDLLQNEDCFWRKKVEIDDKI